MFEGSVFLYGIRGRDSRKYFLRGTEIFRCNGDKIELISREEDKYVRNLTPSGLGRRSNACARAISIARFVSKRAAFTSFNAERTNDLD